MAEYPVFLRERLALWTILKLDSAQNSVKNISVFRGPMLLSVAFSILIQSDGIAFGRRDVGFDRVHWLKDRGTAVHGFKVFLPAILLGIVTAVRVDAPRKHPPDWPLRRLSG